MQRITLQKLTRELCHELYKNWQNDDAKGKGYGTETERLAIKYAFEELGLETVNADTILKNIRSQHILDKLGFEFIKQEGDFKYYHLEKRKWLQV